MDVETLLELYLRDWYGEETAAKASLVWMRPFQYKGTTVGRGGIREGEREMAVFLYQLPMQAKSTIPLSPRSSD